MKNWETLPGLTAYSTAIEMMESYVHQMIYEQAPEKILLLEHEDVYTAGPSSTPSDLIKPNNIPIIETNRGGKLTYHGPGQRIIYPMLNLALSNRTKDLKKYIFDLERWIIATLYELNIEAFVAKDRVGVWVVENGQEKKIASIGVRVKKWITYHGIAINISPDLEKFKGIIPCGLKNYEMSSITSLEKEIDLFNFDAILKQCYHGVF